MSREELEAHITNPKSPVLEVAVASVLVKAMTTGEYTGINFVLDRSIGRVKEHTEITVTKPYVIERLDGTALELGAASEPEADEKPEK